jgi:3-hydroxymyristoyl/3-hydroxydecanoyl-(acyl carrier protein) dehydratase
MPEDLSLFAGHFPGFPLLPGVAQIHWAAVFGAERFPITGKFTRLINIKFQKPVRPGAALQLTLSWDASRGQLAFNYLSGEDSHASGKIEFAGEGFNA